MSNQIVRGEIQSVGDGTLWQRRLLESMLESARLERAIRGGILKDRVNNVIWPQVYDDGILVEVIANDDGTQSLILADGISHSISEVEWAEAESKGFGRFRSAWAEKPVAKIKVRRSDGGYSKIHYNSVPLFHLKLRELIVPGEEGTEQLGNAVQLDMPDDWK